MDDFRCRICDVLCSGPEPYQQHIDGIKHKKKENRALIVRSSQSLNSTAGLNMCNDPPDQCIRPGTNNLDNVTRPLFLTDGCVENENPDLLMNLSDQEISRGGFPRMEMSPSQLDFQNQMQDDYFCRICQIRCSGPEPFQQHTESMKHKKKKNLQTSVLRLSQSCNNTSDHTVSNNLPDQCIMKPGSNGLSNSAKPPFFTDKKNSDSVTNPCDQQIGLGCFLRTETSTQFDFQNPPMDNCFCHVCNIQCSGPYPYQQHLIGKSHEKKMKLLNLTSPNGISNPAQSIPSVAAQNVPSDAFQDVLSNALQDVLYDTAQNGSSDAFQDVLSNALQNVLSDTAQNVPHDASQNVSSDVSESAPASRLPECRPYFTEQFIQGNKQNFVSSNTWQTYGNTLPSTQDSIWKPQLNDSYLLKMDRTSGPRDNWCNENNSITTKYFPTTVSEPKQTDAVEKPSVTPNFHPLMNYNCGLCQIVCSGPDQYRQHMQGKLHAKKTKLQSFDLSANNRQENTFPSTYGRTVLQTSANNLDSVLISGNGKSTEPPPPTELVDSFKNLSIHGEWGYDTVDATFPTKQETYREEMGKTNLTAGDFQTVNLMKYRCEECDVLCSGKEPYNAHVQGKQHKKNLARKTFYPEDDIHNTQNAIPVPPNLSNFSNMLLPTNSDIHIVEEDDEIVLNVV